MQRMNKKADFEFETVIKLMIGAIILIIIITLVFLFKDKSISILDSIKNILRFGK
ncbi:hypothetical protein J4216_06720 [Candidatus Woesearchaeota archaeon]|nr:hypothetical protein [Candidatus Woesearchaeota archaeon]